MKKTLMAIFHGGIIVSLFAGTVYAADIKIGVIDTQRILTESKAGKSARTLFSKEYETRQAELIVKQKEVQTLQEELATKGSEMTTEVYNEKSAAYTKASKQYTRMKSEMEEELEDKDSELSNELLSEISEIVSDYCKKENYTIILEKNYITAYDGAIDITDKIIELYDITK